MTRSMKSVIRISAGALVCALSVGTGDVSAQMPASDPARVGRPALPAAWAVQAPVIDGRLDDDVWQSAAVATDFRQRAPRPGEPSSERTEARVAIDGSALYVAIRAYDSSPDSIASRLARRDATGIYSDWVDVLVDSYHDRRTAYRFSVNPAGVKKDVFHYNDGEEDLGWDAVWDVATQIDDEGWTAEFRIPLSQLRYSPVNGEQTWGLQFGRIIARRDEMSFWSPVLPGVPGFVSVAGTMTGVRGLRAPKRVEALPYIVSKVTRAPAPGGAVASPFWRETQPATSVGADLKYGVTSNLTLTATINPDFGQVEADPSVVNLSAFETFYPERRPFFLEGASLFSFNIGDDNSGEGLFYSRRVGRAPQRRLSADHIDMPESARILGAGKLTGRIGEWSVGAFNTVTQAEHAEYFRDGEIASAPVEPLTNYAVARVNRDFRGGGSTLGLMMTSMNRRNDGDAFDFLRTSAYSAGLRGSHRFGPGNRYAIGGYLAGSSIHGDTLAIQLAQRAPQRFFQRPDADHVDYVTDRTSMQGLAGSIGLDKIGGGNWRGGVGTVFRTPGFEVNDVGFQQNADQRFVYAWFNYSRFQPGRIFRNYAVGINPNSGWDFGGTRLWSQVNVWGNANFANFWHANFFVNNRWHAMSTGALRGGPALYAPGGNNFNLSINTDRRRAISFSASTNGYREKETGVLRYGFGGGITARPSPQFDLSLQPNVFFNSHDWQYVTSPLTVGSNRREYIFAHLDQTTVSLTARANYTFSPNLSFQLYAQPFLSAGEYTDFRRVAAPRARAFDERFHTFADTEITYDIDGRRYTADVGDDDVRFDNPDFNVRSLRSNAVLRWEYRPGSTLFVVWSHGRSDRARQGNFDLRRGLDDLWSLEGTNVVMVKLNYWLNL
jgi:hypothetical protein